MESGDQRGRAIHWGCRAGECQKWGLNPTALFMCFPHNTTLPYTPQDSNLTCWRRKRRPLGVLPLHTDREPMNSHLQDGLPPKSFMYPSLFAAECLYTGSPRHRTHAERGLQWERTEDEEGEHWLGTQERWLLVLLLPYASRDHATPISELHFLICKMKGLD